MLERGEVDAIVKQGPQRAIGHAAIVAGMLGLGEVEQRVADLAPIDDLEPAVAMAPEREQATRTLLAELNRRHLAERAAKKKGGAAAKTPAKKAHPRKKY